MNKNIYTNCRTSLDKPSYKTAQEEYTAKLQTEIRTLLQQIDDKDKQILELKEKIVDYQKLLKSINAQRFLDTFEEWLND